MACPLLSMLSTRCLKKLGVWSRPPFHGPLDSYANAVPGCFRGGEGAGRACMDDLCRCGISWGRSMMRRPLEPSIPNMGNRWRRYGASLSLPSGGRLRLGRARGLLLLPLLHSTGAGLRQQHVRPIARHHRMPFNNERIIGMGRQAVLDPAPLAQRYDYQPGNRLLVRGREAGLWAVGQGLSPASETPHTWAESG